MHKPWVMNIGLIGTAGRHWPEMTHGLQAAGWLSETGAIQASLIWWFWKLIGNTDMHDGKLAFRPGLTLAPAYDMLPMAYAPMRGGERPNRDFSSALPLPAEASIWTRAAEAAVNFWNILGRGHLNSSDDCRRPCSP